MKGVVNKVVNSTLDSIETVYNKLSPQETQLKEEEMPIEDIITSKGYPLEMKHIRTKDGYILRNYRIKGPKGSVTEETRQPVLLVHGLLDSSDSFVCNREDLCIPFLLANFGFDVWITNTRGNKHSRFHVNLSTEEETFWDYSFHEIGKYDIPALLEGIYSETNQKVIYIGHSQGTTSFMVGCSMSPSYFESRVKLFVALSPVCRVTKANSFLLDSLISMQADTLLNSSDQFEVLFHHDMSNKINSYLAEKLPGMVEFLFSMITDDENGDINKERMPVFMGHTPSGTSIKSITHFAQVIRKGEFRMFDYGEKKNSLVYEENEPHEYPVSNISVKTALFSGKLDKFNNEADIGWLEEQLGESLVFSKWYNTGHVGFLLPASKTWLDDLLELCTKYKK